MPSAMKQSARSKCPAPVARKRVKETKRGTGRPSGVVKKVKDSKPVRPSKQMAAKDCDEDVVKVDSVALELTMTTLNQKRPRPHDIMEFYSCPRLVPAAEKLFGLHAKISLDITHGWNGLDIGHQKLAAKLLHHVAPKFLMLSPPCTFFSPLMEMWNFKKMHRLVKALKKKRAFTMVENSVDSALVQHHAERLFCFEHPARATSWKTTVLKEKLKLAGTYEVCFDQCAVGLVSPLGQPMQKKTRLWTNSPGIVEIFQQKQCSCQVEHRRIEGSECGYKLSKWAQKYPDKMVKCLLEGAMKDLR
eukprot:s693_g20.t1